MQPDFVNSLLGAVTPGAAALGTGLGLASLSVFILLIALGWTIAWKGIALWHAARNRQLVWFVILLIVNSLGILEIVYFVFFRKDQNESTSEPKEVVVEEIVEVTEASDAE